MLIQRILKTIASLDFVSAPLRLKLYRKLGLRAERACIYSGCFFTGDDLSNIWLGDRSFLNHHCFLENGAAITIGHKTRLGPGVKILTTTHDLGPEECRTGDCCVRYPVEIGNGCWIGAGVTILPGVKIMDGCVIGAGALVNRDCEPNGLYLGVPAKRVRDLSVNAVHSKQISFLIRPFRV